MQVIDCKAFIWIPTWSMNNTLSSSSQSRAGKRQWVMEVQRHTSTSNSWDKNIAKKNNNSSQYISWSVNFCKYSALMLHALTVTTNDNHSQLWKTPCSRHTPSHTVVSFTHKGIDQSKHTPLNKKMWGWDPGLSESRQALNSVYCSQEKDKTYRLQR